MSDLPPWLRPHRDGATIHTLVQPRSGASRIVGPYGDALKIRIAAAPVDGAANSELAKLLADKLSVKARQIEIIAGQRGRRKSVLVRGISATQVFMVLGPEMN